jgi:hypothetical protein
MSEQRVQDELVKWEEQKRVRLTHGDKLDHPREIEHFATFKSKANAEKAAGALKAQGYAVSMRKKGLFGVDMMTSRNDSFIEIEKILDSIIQIIDTHGGIYDGFGAEIVE